MDEVRQRLLEAVKSYRMPQAAIDMLTANPPLVIAGISASGKDSIEQYIENTGGWRHIVTHTTREIRPGEANGKDYWFISEEEMLKMVDNQAFIEVQLIHGRQVSGSGMAVYKHIVDEGKKPIVDIEIQGIKQLHIHVPNIRPFFILPPSIDAWAERMDGRGHMSYVEKTQRMQSARQELEEALKNERFILVINDEISRAAKEIMDGRTDPAAQERAHALAHMLIEHTKAY